MTPEGPSPFLPIRSDIPGHPLNTLFAVREGGGEGTDPIRESGQTIPFIFPSTSPREAWKER